MEHAVLEQMVTPANDSHAMLIVIIVALALSLLILAGFALLAMRRSSRIALVCFWLLLAVFPVWASVITILVGSVPANGSEYWVVAPWLVLMSFFFVQYALAVAVLTAAVYFFTSGSFQTKLKRSLLFLPVFSVVAVLAAWGVQRHHVASQAGVKRNEDAVATFVNRSNELAAALTRWGSVHAKWIGESNGRQRYLIFVSAPQSSETVLQGIVEKGPRKEGERLRIMCLTEKLESLKGWTEPGFTCPPPKLRQVEAS